MPEDMNHEPVVDEPGIYNLTNDEYWADPCKPASLSSSGARQIIATCPAKYWWERNNPKDKSDAMKLGSVAHEWLLEGEAWNDHYFILPENFDGRTKAGKSAILQAEEEGKEPLKHEAFETVKAMKLALEAHPYATAALTGGQAEKSLFWKDEQYGVWCRCRPDYKPDKREIISDYKTTRSAEPEYLSKVMFDYGYHQQAEWYLRGIQTLGIMESPRFLFIFQETEPPYVVTCATPDENALGWAGIQNRKSIEVFARCLRDGHWPAYAGNIINLELPGYAEYKLQVRSERGHFETAALSQSPLEAAE